MRFFRREEASSIPTLLVAAKVSSNDRDIYEDGVGDSRGWYSDGAYTAVPIASEEGDIDSRDPQTLFYESLISKYKAIRARLNQTPPQETQDELDLRLYPTHAKNSAEGAADWMKRLRDTSPNMMQLALLSQFSVLRILAWLTIENAVLRRGMEINEHTSLWLWGLLARVPDRGELSSEQISIVRELGKKAVLVRLGFKEAEDWSSGLDVLEAGMDGDVDHDADFETPQTAAEIAAEAKMSRDQDTSSDEAIADPAQSLEETVDATTPSKKIASEPQTSTAVEEPSSTTVLTKDAEAEELAGAKARFLESLKAEEQEQSAAADSIVPSKNTRVALDMILTVAGEVYGQRDLLEFRETWHDETGTY